MAVSKIYNSDEVSRGYQEILAGCLSPSKGKRSSFFFLDPKTVDKLYQKLQLEGNMILRNQRSISQFQMRGNFVYRTEYWVE